MKKNEFNYFSSVKKMKINTSPYKGVYFNSCNIKNIDRSIFERSKNRRLGFAILRVRGAKSTSGVGVATAC